MLKFLFWVITLYFLYRLIFYFIIPLFRASRQVKRQMREFQDRMNEGQQAYQQNHAPFNQANSAAAPKTEKSGEYIDFEEIK